MLLTFVVENLAKLSMAHEVSWKIDCASDPCTYRLTQTNFPCIQNRVQNFILLMVSLPIEWCTDAVFQWASPWARFLQGSLKTCSVWNPLGWASASGRLKPYTPFLFYILSCGLWQFMRILPTSVKRSVRSHWTLRRVTRYPKKSSHPWEYPLEEYQVLFTEEETHQSPLTVTYFTTKSQVQK